MTEGRPAWGLVVAAVAVTLGNPGYGGLGATPADQPWCTSDALLCEDFEDTDFGSRGWYDGPRGELSSSEHAPGGSRALECHYASGTQVCEAGTPGRRLFGPTESVLLDYWVKYGAGFVGSGRPYHPHEFLFLTNKDGPFIGPAGTHLTTYVEQLAGVPRLALQDMLNVDTRCVLRNDDSFVGCGGDFDSFEFTEARSVASCNGLAGDLDKRDCFQSDAAHWYSARVWDAAPNVRMYDDNWHHVSALFRLNSIIDGRGVPDGAMRYWLDGTEVISYDHILYRTAANADLLFNQLLLAPYIGDGSPVDQTMWIDDLRVLPDAADEGDAPAAVFMPLVSRGPVRSTRPRPTPTLAASPTPTSSAGEAPVRIAEVAPSGSDLVDEDGAVSDWIELENTSSRPASLAGYRISDDPRAPDKWALPDVQLPPGGRVVILASGKDRPHDPADWDEPQTDHWETAVSEGVEWQFAVGGPDISPAWMEPDFAPSAWQVGPGGVGYGDDDDGTVVPDGTASVYMRAEFEIPNVAEIAAAILSVDFDDGFVAYLNGVEIARQGLVGEPPAWSELAAEHEARLYSGETPESFSIETEIVSGTLRQGRNILAVEVHNTSPDSSDLSLRPFLHVGLRAAGQRFDPTPPWFAPPQAGGARPLHASFKLKKGETLTLTTADGTTEDVEVLESLHYGHVMARIGDAWCVSDLATPGASNNGPCYTDYASAPEFSVAPGFYDVPLSVQIEGADVVYTADGSMPVATSTGYDQPIAVGRSAVLRAVAREPGKLPSDVATATYLIGEATGLPVVSVAAAPRDLFADGTGGPAIYDNYESGEKVACAVSYFGADRAERFTEQCAVRIVGNFSKAFAQKSFQFTFESDFGAKGDVPNVIFQADKPELGDLHGFRVRNMDDDATSARMRDVIANRMALQTGAGTTASQNVAVFVNGEYWGHYVARELLNEYFVRDNYGADPDEVDIVKTHVGETFADSGDMADFDDLVAFISASDLSDRSSFAEAEQRADLENWADYWATEIYIANGDWYSSQWLNNIQAFRARPPKGDGKWRFVLWDCAYSQNLGGGVTAADFDSLDFALANPAQANRYTDMFVSLLANEEFRRGFINRFADLMNGPWAPERMAAMIASNASQMASEVEPNYARWTPQCGGQYCPPDRAGWEWSVDQVRAFFAERPAHQREHIRRYFGLAKEVDVRLDVSPPGGGTVRISTLTPSGYPWSGTYFDGNPVTLSATPAPGYTFVGWSASPLLENLSDAVFTTNVDVSATFVANFALSRPAFVTNVAP